MRHPLTAALLTSVCALALGPALAGETGVKLSTEQGVVKVKSEKQPALAFSGEQRQAIIDAVVQRDTHQPTPKEFEAKEGAAIPSTLDIHALPPRLINEIPALKEYWYAHLNKNIVIVDAHEKKVAILIPLPENLVRDKKKTDPKQAAENAVGGLPGLSDEQRRGIYQAATGAPQAAPEGTPLRAGAQVPAGLSAQPLPAEVVGQTPPLQGLNYVKLQDGRLLLINPEGKIAGVITHDEGTKVAQDGADKAGGNNTGVSGTSSDPMREREESGKPSAYSGPTTTGPNTGGK